MVIRYGGLDLSSSERQKAEAHVREELGSIVLIDIVVSDGGRDFDLVDLTQKHADQAAYDEAYLSLDGTGSSQGATGPAVRDSGSPSSYIL